MYKELNFLQTNSLNCQNCRPQDDVAVFKKIDRFKMKYLVKEEFSECLFYREHLLYSFGMTNSWLFSGTMNVEHRVKYIKA